MTVISCASHAVVAYIHHGGTYTRHSAKMKHAVEVDADVIV